MVREGWYRRITVDLFVWVIAVLLCMFWRWVSEKNEIGSYWSLFAVLAALWIILGIILQLYRPYKETYLWQSMLSLIADAGILIGLCWWVLPQLPFQLSPRVAAWTVLIVPYL